MGLEGKNSCVLVSWNKNNYFVQDLVLRQVFFFKTGLVEINELLSVISERAGGRGEIYLQIK